MELSFEIQENIFRILKQSEIPSLINGHIYLGNINLKSQNEDIEINVLTNTPNYLQKGYANINFYCLNTTANLPDNRRLKEITKKIVELFKDIQFGRYFFQVDTQTGPFKDQDRDKMHYSNIRLTYQIH